MPTSDTNICPFCTEEIKKAAIVCKHCGRELPGFEDHSPPISRLISENINTPRNKSMGWKFGVIAGFVLTFIYIIIRLPEINAASQINAQALTPLLLDLYVQAFSVYIVFTLFGLLTYWLWDKSRGVLVALIIVSIYLSIISYQAPHDSGGNIKNNELSASTATSSTGFDIEHVIESLLNSNYQIYRPLPEIQQPFFTVPGVVIGIIEDEPSQHFFLQSR